MFLAGHFAHGLGIKAVAMGGRAGAANAAIHRRNQHRSCAAEAGLSDKDLQIGLVGGLRLHIGLRPALFRIVVRELHEEIVARLHLAQDFVQAQGAHKDFMVSPDCAWFETATPGLKKRGSNCPQLTSPPPSRSVTVDRPR